MKGENAKQYVERFSMLETRMKINNCSISPILLVHHFLLKANLSPITVQNILARIKTENNPSVLKDVKEAYEKLVEETKESKGAEVVHYGQIYRYQRRDPSHSTDGRHPKDSNHERKGQERKKSQFNNKTTSRYRSRHQSKSRSSDREKKTMTETTKSVSFVRNRKVKTQKSKINRKMTSIDQVIKSRDC